MVSRVNYLFLFFLILLSCSHRQIDNSVQNPSSKIIKVRCKTVVESSITKPTIKKVNTPKIIKTGSPTVFQVRTNIIPAGNPKKIIVNNPKEIIPGQDKFSVPRAIEATGNRYLVNQPIVVEAKDPYVKDQNPHNFSSYSKLQGLNHNMIKCMLQDQNNNLWIGTWGGGACKFDGKFFTHFTDNEGLPNNNVSSILEDRDGNIWFGTLSGGICKYDGKYFVNYKDKDGLSHVSVSSIIEDKNGDLWVGTLGGGVCKFNGKQFTTYSESEGLVNNYVNSILEDKNGNLWISTDNGISIYKGNKFINYTAKEGFTNKKIWSIFQDSKDIIWICTDGDGIFKYDGNYFMNYTINEGLSNNYVSSGLEDNQGNLWFCTDGGGVLKFDGSSFTQYSVIDGLPNISVSTILEDKNHNIWIGTWGGGISKYSGNTFTHLTEIEGLTNYSIRSIIEDRKGNLWFSTWGWGINRYNGKTIEHFSIDDGLSHNIVRCSYEDSKGNLWFGTWGNGVNKFDGSSFTHFTEKEGIVNNKIWCIQEDHKGNIWFGTWNGLSKYDGTTFTNYDQSSGLSNEMVSCIMEDHNKNLWFGTWNGVTKFDGKTFTHFTEEEGLSDNTVNVVIEDNYGNIWIGCNSGGINILTKEPELGSKNPIKPDEWNIIHLTENDGLASDNIFSLLVDKSGNIFIGTRFGLGKINTHDIPLLIQQNTNTSGQFIKNYGYEDGFLGIGINGGHTICQTKDGSIWIGANDRPTVFHPKGDFTDTIPPNIQLVSIELFEEHINWSKQVSIKEIPDKTNNLSINSKDTNLILSNGVRFSKFKFDDLSKWYGLPINLSLAHNNNYITFNFIGITLKHNKKVKYKYKLEGIDENWSTITSRTYANYGNLPHGSYEFKVKAMNSDGFWSKSFNYSFTIRPPWWKTSWFKILLALFVSAVLAGLYQWRVSELKKQKRLLKILVAQKTEEIVQQKEELQRINEHLIASNEELDAQKEELETTLKSLTDAQNQLIQSEKMASLGTLAAGVAHEINNPLNFIKGGIFGIEDYFRKHLTNKESEEYKEIQPLIEGIQVGVDRAAAIVTSLNQYSRKNDKPSSQVQIHSVIENCLTILQNQIKYKVEIEKDYTSQPHTLICNEGKLHQAIINILINSIQAITDQGKITIKTEIIVNKLRISISDTGCGISKENLSKIFDPFFTTKDPGKGTGLGLSITYNIIQEHNGTIDIKSEVDKGTTTIITLPLKV